MAWCQMFSDVYNVSPLSEVIGRFVLPQTAACRFSKDEIRVSNPDSIHGNCSGRFRFPGILAALRIGPKEMPTVGVPHHTTLMLISHVGWANWWSLFIVCHSQRASSTSGDPGDRDWDESQNSKWCKKCHVTTSSISECGDPAVHQANGGSELQMDLWTTRYNKSAPGDSNLKQNLGFVTGVDP